MQSRELKVIESEKDWWVRRGGDGGGAAKGCN
jgi:hypothetical protein